MDYCPYNFRSGKQPDPRSVYAHRIGAQTTEAEHQQRLDEAGKWICDSLPYWVAIFVFLLCAAVCFIFARATGRYFVNMLGGCCSMAILAGFLTRVTMLGSMSGDRKLVSAIARFMVGKTKDEEGEITNSPPDYMSLMFSPDEHERRARLFGFINLGDQPVFLDEVLLQGGVTVCGPKGDGKTSKALSPHIYQEMLRGQAAIIIIDCKGKEDWPRSLEPDCRTCGYTFKRFTLSRGTPTHLFDFMGDPEFQRLTPEQRADILANGIGANLGPGSANQHWSLVSTSFLERCFGALRFRTLRELSELIDDKRVVCGQLRMTEQEFVHGAHARNALRTLAKVFAINATSTTHPNIPQEAFDNAITIKGMLTERQVTFFSLPVSEYPIVAPMIAKIILQLVTALAPSVRGSRKVVLVIDEAHYVLNSYEAIAPLTLSREDFELVTATQVLGNAKGRGTGDQLTQSLLVNSKCVVITAATEPVLRDWLIEKSGLVSGKRIGGNAHGATWVEVPQPRLDEETIRIVSDCPHLAFVWMASVPGSYSCFDGPVIVELTRHLTKEEWERRIATPLVLPGGVIAADYDTPPPAPVTNTPPPPPPRPPIAARAKKKPKKKKED